MVKNQRLVVPVVANLESYVFFKIVSCKECHKLLPGNNSNKNDRLCIFSVYNDHETKFYDNIVIKHGKYH